MRPHFYTLPRTHRASAHTLNPALHLLCLGRDLSSYWGPGFQLAAGGEDVPGLEELWLPFQKPETETLVGGAKRGADRPYTTTPAAVRAESAREGRGRSVSKRHRGLNTTAGTPALRGSGPRRVLSYKLYTVCKDDISRAAAAAGMENAPLPLRTPKNRGANQSWVSSALQHAYLLPNGANFRKARPYGLTGIRHPNPTFSNARYRHPSPSQPPQRPAAVTETDSAFLRRVRGSDPLLYASSGCDRPILSTLRKPTRYSKISCNLLVFLINGVQPGPTGSGTPWADRPSGQPWPAAVSAHEMSGGMSPPSGGKADCHNTGAGSLQTAATVPQSRFN
ncbi:hypothetical protein SKAU_G00402540 [Synaphobranchus kaupii]|uniref:Uncharacterized protein n=1 Tax=Synaphobranchus kaupii TaxID=118154 RepID=A0A9Q1E9C1_SYNKA|nr:hypothetical protein SKAU_G00402540 [Synaphobranchus kaupii]